ncbi:MAG: YegS/Rv2252/BmrU family lipid kinase [Armatimonadota bacterium]|nr:YegS/Rv2252/BmrU family lipid kinase [Armatimonadota bacterium]
MEYLPKRAAFYANSKSRRGADWFAPACVRLRAGGLELTDTKLFDSNAEVVDAASKAIAEGEAMVIVGGGDGTISSAAHLFERSNAILGVLPFGTGNAFAKDIGIPPEMEKACDVLIDGRVAEVDVGVANRRLFLNVATLGISTLIAQDLSSGIKKVAASAAYLIALVRALNQVKPFRATLIADGEEHVFDTLQIVVGNGRFHAGPFLIAEDASIEAGTLSIYALATKNKFDFIKLALRLRSGKQGGLREAKTFRAKRVHLETQPSRKITLDGEVLLETPVEFSVLPGAIRVAVPKDWNSHAINPP